MGNRWLEGGRIIMFRFLILKPEAFGLDISDLSLKIIKLRRKKKTLSLVSFGEISLQPGVIESGEVKDGKALAEAINLACSKIKGERLGTKYVIASLPEEKSFIQAIKMPLMGEEELKKAVYFEAENYIPLPIKEVYLDSQIISSTKEHTNVLIAALPKKIVDPYVVALKNGGLIPLALEVESLAVSRALVEKKTDSPPLLLIDLGATRTSFIIFSGHSVRFTSSIPVSSQKLTEAIARYLKMDIDEAEKLKIKHGLEYQDKEGKEVFNAIVPGLADLIKQIKKHLDYYQTHATDEHTSPNNKKMTKIFLCGGGANLKGLADFISSEFKIPVELANPWVNILPRPLKKVPEISFKKSLSYTTALGLSLRGVQEPLLKDHD